MRLRRQRQIAKLDALHRASAASEAERAFAEALTEILRDRR